MMTFDKFLIGAIVSISLWFATQWVRMGRRWLQRRSEKRNLVRALFSEIDFNTSDLNRFVADADILNSLRALFEEMPNLIPHITDAHHTLIYRGNVDKLHYIDDEVIARLVQFYGILDKIKEQIDGLNAPSYQTISLDSRHKAVVLIFQNAEKCRDIGEVILKKMRRSHPNYGLERQNWAEKAPK